MSEQGPGDGGQGSPRPPRRSAGSSTMDPLIGRVVLDRYEILQRIGSGGMGAVYTGRQRSVDRQVALKVLRTDLMNNEHIRQRFKREADIIGKLRHPNTIQLIDYGETEEGLAIMVMELLHGKSLSDHLKTEGPLPLEKAIEFGEEVCASLAEAHLYGLVHRDLKPANIFLAEVGNAVHAKVLDFGIARLLDEESTRLTSTGQVFGTPRYMSPEQAMSTADVDGRSDLYSLGLILYESIVGQPPFVAQTSIQYLSAHSTQEPPKLGDHFEGAPVALEALIDACLAKEPEQRPQTAEEVGGALRTIRTALQTGIAPETMPLLLGKTGPTRPALNTAMTVPGSSADDGTSADSTAPPRAGGPSKLIWAVAALLLVLVAGAGYALWGRDSIEVSQLPNGDPLANVEGADGGNTALAMASTDAGANIVAAADPADAGRADLGSKPVVADAGHRSPPPPPPTKHVGDGTFDGPRKIRIVTPQEKERRKKLISRAQRCTSSQLAGLARLSTKRCKEGCAIMVDQLCAGRTPAVNTHVSPGRHEIFVICGEKIVKRRRLKFRANKTRTFSCR